MDEKSDLIIIIVIFIIFGTILLVMAVMIGQKIREARVSILCVVIYLINNLSFIRKYDFIVVYLISLLTAI